MGISFRPLTETERSRLTAAIKFLRMVFPKLDPAIFDDFQAIATPRVLEKQPILGGRSTSTRFREMNQTEQTAQIRIVQAWLETKMSEVSDPSIRSISSQEYPELVNPLIRTAAMVFAWMTLGGSSRPEVWGATTDPQFSNAMKYLIGLMFGMDSRYSAANREEAQLADNQIKSAGHHSPSTLAVSSTLFRQSSSYRPQPWQRGGVSLADYYPTMWPIPEGANPPDPQRRSAPTMLWLEFMSNVDAQFVHWVLTDQINSDDDKRYMRQLAADLVPDSQTEQAKLLASLESLRNQVRAEVTIEQYQPRPPVPEPPPITNYKETKAYTELNPDKQMMVDIIALIFHDLSIDDVTQLCAVVQRVRKDGEQYRQSFESNRFFEIVAPFVETIRRKKHSLEQSKKRKHDLANAETEMRHELWSIIQRVTSSKEGLAEGDVLLFAERDADRLARELAKKVAEQAERTGNLGIVLENFWAVVLKFPNRTTKDVWTNNAFADQTAWGDPIVATNRMKYRACMSDSIWRAFVAQINPEMWSWLLRTNTQETSAFAPILLAQDRERVGSTHLRALNEMRRRIRKRIKGDIEKDLPAVEERLLPGSQGSVVVEGRYQELPSPSPSSSNFEPLGARLPASRGELVIPKRISRSVTGPSATAQSAEQDLDTEYRHPLIALIDNPEEIAKNIVRQVVYNALIGLRFPQYGLFGVVRALVDLGVFNQSNRSQGKDE